MVPFVDEFASNHSGFVNLTGAVLVAKCLRVRMLVDYMSTTNSYSGEATAELGHSEKARKGPNYFWLWFRAPAR